MKTDWKFAKARIKRVVLVIYGCWIIGGVVAIALAFVFPENFDRLVYAVPIKTVPRIGYAWVGGSIWGGMIGGVISVIHGLIITNKAWKAVQGN